MFLTNLTSRSHLIPSSINTDLNFRVRQQCNSKQSPVRLPRETLILFQNQFLFHICCSKNRQSWTELKCAPESPASFCNDTIHLFFVSSYLCVPPMFQFAAQLNTILCQSSLFGCYCRLDASSVTYLSKNCYFLFTLFFPLILFLLFDDLPFYLYSISYYSFALHTLLKSNIFLRFMREFT